MAQVNITMIQAANVNNRVITVDPNKWRAIGFYLVYAHHVPKYAELPAAARELIAIKEIGKHLETHVIWQS